MWTGRSAGDQRALLDGSGAPSPVPRSRKIRCLNQVHGARVLAVGALHAHAAEVYRAAPDSYEHGTLPEGYEHGPLPEGYEHGPLPEGYEHGPLPEGYEHGPLPEGDALVSIGDRSCLGVLTADCAAVALGSPEGIFAAVHAGWRGLIAGVVEAAVAAVRALGAEEVLAGLGPCIHPCCYRFAAPELDTLAQRYGADVRALTTTGEPALDLPRAVGAALARAGAQLVVDLDRCTACDDDGFSYRARKEQERQALFVWMEAGPP